MIREIQESELSQLLQLYQHLHERDEPLPPQDEVDQIWSQIQQNPGLFYFGAFIDSRLISYARLA